MTSSGDILSLAIDKPAAGGRMIGRADRLVVLVSGAIPGERVRAVVERMGKGVAYATTLDVEEASSDRRTLASDPLCGGCLYAHIAYPRQLDLKSLVIADAFARIGHMTLPSAISVTPSPEQGYRMRARLHVRDRLVGFYREGTHEVCEARQTGQLLPGTVDALERLLGEMAACGIEGVRELEVAENVDVSARAVALASRAAIGAPVLARLADASGVTGLSTPYGEVGDAWVTDRLAIGAHPPVSLRRHVLAFFQGNRFLLDALVGYVMEQVPDGGEVLDLYAGVGLFSLTAAALRGASVTAIEGDRIAAADLAVNAGASEGRVVAVHQAVETAVGAAGRRRLAVGRSATVIVDPPRTGMSREALDGVIALNAPRIVYVSCDVATLARDARRLVDSGYTLTTGRAFDLFPNTPHVETVMVFRK